MKKNRANDVKTNEAKTVKTTERRAENTGNAAVKKASAKNTEAKAEDGKTATAKAADGKTTTAKTTDEYSAVIKTAGATEAEVEVEKTETNGDNKAYVKKKYKSMLEEYRAEKERAEKEDAEKEPPAEARRNTRRRINKETVPSWLENAEPLEEEEEWEMREYDEFIKREEERVKRNEDNYFEEKRKCDLLLNETEYRRVIRMWVERVPFAEFVQAIEARVIGQENVKAVCYNIYHYLELTGAGSKKSLPFILAAPSGCGKSETYRAVRDYFKENLRFLVCGYIDASELTEAGFKGNNPETIVYPLSDRAPANGIGIIFLDEMDKKILPSYSSSGQNVNAAVQHGLLTIIEGREVSSKTGKTIDTNNTLFIAMGAFDFVRNEKDEEKVISIGRTVEKRDHFDDISREEMLEAGALNELIGRFHTIINYHKLTEESVRRILNLNIAELSDEFGIPIVAAENFYSEMYAISNGKFGCRTLKNRLRDRIQALDMEIKFEGKSKNALIFHLDENGDYVEEKYAEVV